MAGKVGSEDTSYPVPVYLSIGSTPCGLPPDLEPLSQMATFRRGGKRGEGLLHEAVHSVITLLTCTPGQRS